MKYKVGQILTSTCDVEVEKMFGEKVIIPKGNKIIIGADKLAHHLSTGMIQPLQKDAVVKGYDAEGLAECIYTYLKARFPIEEMIDGYEIGRNDIQNEIEYCLEDLGFC